jgi:hypothetical protein
MKQEKRRPVAGLRCVHDAVGEKSVHAVSLSFEVRRRVSAAFGADEEGR